MGNARHVHGPVTTAKDGRFADGGLIAVQGPTAIDTRTGVLVGPGSTALVTGTAATAPMTVAIAPHHWVTTRGAANGPYLGALEAATTVTIPAAPAAGTGTRIDVVYSKQQDAQAGIPTPDGTTAPLYGVVSGVAGGAKPALPVGAEELATVAVSPGATATNGVNVTITNTARQTVARGGILPVRSTETDAGVYDGQYRDHPTWGLQRWSTARTRWEKWGGSPVLLASDPDVGGGANFSGGTLESKTLTVPAHSAGTLHVQFTGSWYAAAAQAVTGRLTYGSTPFVSGPGFGSPEVQGSAMRSLNNGVVNAPAPLVCDGYIATDGSASTLRLVTTAEVVTNTFILEGAFRAWLA